MSFRQVLSRGKARRRMAAVAVSGVLGVAGVIASTPAPAEAGPISVSLSASSTYLLVGQATTLTATAAVGAAGTTPVNYLEIFDTTTGTLLCAAPTGSTCTATESQSVAITHEFVAYVAAFDPTGIFPPPKVAATSAPVMVTWEPLHRIGPV
jgi:hypothetical protein